MLKKLFANLLFSFTLSAAPVYFQGDKVIKPNDPNCNKVPAHAPCTRSVQAEVFSYAFADLIGLGHLIPETHLAKLSFDGVEKSCSVQQYLPNIEILCDLAKKWLDAKLSDEQVLTLIDPANFEEIYLLMLLMYDTDGHSNNILARKDEYGIYHLIKIDNSLTFPNRNYHFINALALLPQANRKFSENTIQRIHNLPMKKIAEKFIEFEMKEAFKAFAQRVEVLKQLTDHSMREIDPIFYNLERDWDRLKKIDHFTISDLGEILVEGANSVKDRRGI